MFVLCLLFSLLHVRRGEFMGRHDICIIISHSMPMRRRNGESFKESETCLASTADCASGATPNTIWHAFCGKQPDRTRNPMRSEACVGGQLGPERATHVSRYHRAIREFG